MMLVTGGAGFIGSNLVADLCATGHRVVVNDTVEGPYKPRHLSGLAVDEVVAPEALPGFLERRGEEIDAVFHLGAITSTTVTDLALLRETNVALSQRLWRWCAERGVPLIYASSAATYGDGSNGFRDDDDPASLARLRPLNPYGDSKHAFDRWVAAEVTADRPRPPRWAGLKLFNVYGPREDHKGDMRSVVAKSYAAAARGEPVRLFRSHRPDVPDGGQKRDFVHVRDCVAVMRWLAEGEAPDGIYNVGTGRARSWLELMGALYDAVGSPLHVEWIDTPEAIRDRYQYFTQADVSKLRRAGYPYPFTPIEDGVREYVHGYLGGPSAG